VCEDVLPEFRHDALRGRGEQEDLHEIHQPLKGEQHQKSERDPIEQCAIAGLKGGVEQVADNEWKGEADGGRNEQTECGENQSPAIRADTREQTTERPRGTKSATGALSLFAFAQR
jgi:hypothetical protein